MNHPQAESASSCPSRVRHRATVQTGPRLPVPPKTGPWLLEMEEGPLRTGESASDGQARAELGETIWSKPLLPEAVAKRKGDGGGTPVLRAFLEPSALGEHRVCCEKLTALPSGSAVLGAPLHPQVWWRTRMRNQAGTGVPEDTSVVEALGWPFILAAALSHPCLR